MSDERRLAMKVTQIFKLTAIYAASLVVLGLALLLVLLPTLISNSCDEAIGARARNSRGDVVEEQLTICTGIGTVISGSIVLVPQRPSFIWKVIILAEYDPVSDSSPAFRWLNDDRLDVELGDVRAVWSQVYQLGSMRITNSYSKAEQGARGAIK